MTEKNVPEAQRPRELTRKILTGDIGGGNSGEVRVEIGNPGDQVREMASKVAKQAMSIPDGVDERIENIKRTAENSLAQLNDALDRFRENNRRDAGRLAEAVVDQFNLLAMQIDDLTTHCSLATEAFKQHRDNINSGIAALQVDREKPSLLEKPKKQS